MNKNSCDYLKYYSAQIGGNLDDKILVYKGRPFQRGSGLFSKLRYSIPYLKTIGREVLDLGKNILFDYASGQSFKSASRKNLKRKASDLLKKAADKVDQYGSGKKRKRYQKIRRNQKVTKFVKRHIKKGKKIKRKTVYTKRRKVKPRLKTDIFK